MGCRIRLRSDRVSDPEATGQAQQRTPSNLLLGHRPWQSLTIPNQLHVTQSKQSTPQETSRSVSRGARAHLSHYERAVTTSGSHQQLMGRLFYRTDSIMSFRHMCTLFSGSSDCKGLLPTPSQREIASARPFLLPGTCRSTSSVRCSSHRALLARRTVPRGSEVEKALQPP